MTEGGFVRTVFDGYGTLQLPGIYYDSVVKTYTYLTLHDTLANWPDIAWRREYMVEWFNVRKGGTGLQAPVLRLSRSIRQVNGSPNVYRHDSDEYAAFLNPNINSIWTPPPPGSFSIGSPSVGGGWIYLPVTVSQPVALQWQLINLQGQTLMAGNQSFPTDGTLQMQVFYPPSGIYVLRLTDTNSGYIITKNIFIS
jgi:hypothetical protein